MSICPMIWKEDHLLMLDQRILPTKTEWVRLESWEAVRDAIRDMTVRGAPAIGIAAGYGMALAALTGANLEEAHAGLAASRPTAVNLFWALDRISKLTEKSYDSISLEAQSIEREDLEMNHTIGRNGNLLIPQKARILTICNTGGLATAGHGTALGVIRSAHESGKDIFVYSCETRPRQQGLRLTAYELMHDKIPFQSIGDSMAASLMQQGIVDLVIAGADRIANNGDTANKIGTYMLAVLADYHKIPFYIAAPSSTFDLEMATGAEIPIEERDSTELTHIEGVQIAPTDCPVYNPGFDVTPGKLITSIISEIGVHQKDSTGDMYNLSAKR